MSERKWNHPVFEEIKHAEVSAPEHIMHAAIKKSNRRGFFFFDWRTLNVWYILLGLGLLSTYWTWNSQSSIQPTMSIKGSSKSTAILQDKLEESSPVISAAPQIAQPIAKQRKQRNVSAMDEQTPSFASDQIASVPQTMTEQETAVNKSEGVVSISLTDSSEKIIDKPVAPETKTMAQPKKGRALRVKIGENSKP